MYRKLLLGGSCLILGICLLVANRVREVSAATPAKSTSSGEASRNHSSARSPSPSAKDRSTEDVRRSALIGQLDSIVKSGGQVDRDRFSALLIQLVGIDPKAAGHYAAPSPQDRFARKPCAGFRRRGRQRIPQAPNSGSRH